MRHREAADDIGDGRDLGTIGLKKLEPCWGREKKIADFDCGSRRMTCGFDGTEVSGITAQHMRIAFAQPR